MALTLRNMASIERLIPAATDAELRWFQRKRLRAVGRSLLLGCGAGALWFAGSFFRDPARAHDGFFRVALAVLGFWQVGALLSAIDSAKRVKDIQARRITMRDEQRERIFLRALDDDVPEA